MSRLLFGTVVAIYVLTFPYHPKLRSPNELCRLWQTRALVEYGTIHINDALRDFGYVGDLSRRGGKYYPSKAPLLSFAAVPVYAAMKVIGGGHLYAVAEVPLVYWSRLFLTVLPTLVMLVFLRRFLRAYVDAEVADALTATYALGTLAFSYSLLFMSHQTTAVLIFAAFYALWRSLRGDWRTPWLGYVAAGVAAGAAVAAEYTGAIGVAGVAVYGAIAVLSKRENPPALLWARLGKVAVLAALGAAPIVAALLAYHWAAFGHPLDTGYKYLNDPGYQPWHLGGFLGIRTPDPRAFVLSFFSPLRGLFALSPFLLVGVAGLWAMWRAERVERALFWTTAALLLAYAYFTSSFAYDSWGWTTGPRHLTPLSAFLLLPAGLAVERVRARAALLGAVAGLCAVSILVTGAATFVDYIPDDVSNPVFALALPLFLDGYLPPSVLSLVGIENPWSGGLLVALLIFAAVMTARLLLSVGAAEAQGHEGPRRAPWSASTAAAASCALVLVLHAAATRHDRADVAALEFLRAQWLAPPGGGSVQR